MQDNWKIYDFYYYGKNSISIDAIYDDFILNIITRVINKNTFELENTRFSLEYATASYYPNDDEIYYSTEYKQTKKYLEDNDMPSLSKFVIDLDKDKNQTDIDEINYIMTQIVAEDENLLLFKNAMSAEDDE